MFGVLVNVGSTSLNPNGRGRIFEDQTFEYLPIPEDEETLGRTLSYRDISFAHVRFPDLRVHLDPEFKTFTYGHVKRGFGDVQNLLRLKKDDVLFFYATLQRGDKWLPCVIGYFKNLEMCDCRSLSKEEIIKLKTRGFQNNAHLKRIDPSVDFLIKGDQDSKLLKRAFPLAENNNPLQLKKSLENIVFTASEKKIVSGKPWFRWTLICNDANRMLEMVNGGNSA